MGFLLLPVIIAEEVSDPFEAADVIAPPKLPEEDTELYSVEFELYDYNTKTPIKEIHATVELEKEGEKFKTIKYINEQGVLKLQLEAGQYSITLKVDELSTAGKDYYIIEEKSVNSDVSGQLFLFPVASVHGAVYDKKQQAVPGASIKFSCSGSYGELAEFNSDNYGSFSNDWLPIGVCRIYAMSGASTGFAEINAEQGQLYDVSVNLDQKVKSGNLGYTLVFIVGIVAVIYYVFYFRKGNVKVKEPGKTDGSREGDLRVLSAKKFKMAADGLTRRQKDVLKTLGEKERDIIKFLVQSGNKSTQAYIKNELGIPKTSLSRLLDNLSNKNVISIEKVGKMKKVKLTGWFLDED